MPDLWAHLAEHYEQAYGPKTESPCWPRAKALAVRVEGRVLDIACGPGFDLSLFREGIGIDSSPAMLRAARLRAPGAGLVLGDMRALPFKPNSFAAAFSCLALIHLTKAELALLLLELRALLQPGAPVVAVFFAGEGERVTGFSPVDPNAVAQYAYYGAEELRGMFAGAGYREITVDDDVLNEPTRRGIPCLCVASVTPVAGVSEPMLS